MTVRAAHIAAWWMAIGISGATPLLAIDAVPEPSKSVAEECVRNLVREGRRSIEGFVSAALGSGLSLDLLAPIRIRVTTQNDDQAIAIRQFAHDFDLDIHQVDMKIMLIDTEVRHLVSLISKFMAVKYTPKNARMIDGVFELYVVQPVEKKALEPSY